MKRWQKHGFVIEFFIIFILIGVNSVDFSNMEEIIPEDSQNNIRIVTSITIAYDIVSNIAGDHAVVDVIVSGAVDVHSFQGPTSTQKQLIADADIFFSMGVPGLEPWLEDTMESLGDDAPKVIGLIQNSMIKSDPLLDGSTNPHVWMDPNNIKIMADNVTRELTIIDSTNQVSYESNNVTYSAKLDSLMGRIISAKTEYNGLKVVTHHPAFMYLFDLLDINRTAVIAKVEGQEPSPAYIGEIIELMIDENITLLINSPQLPDDEVNEIARHTDAKIADLTPLLFVNDQNGNVIDTYIKMIDYNLWALSNPEDPPSIPGYSLIYIVFSIGIAIIFLKSKLNQKIN